MSAFPWQTRSYAFTGFSSGGLAAIKWLALALMLVDHVEAFWLHRSIDTQLGRLVFPLFAIVLGYNVARPGVDRGRVFARLVLFGCLALPFHAWLTHAPLSLNVLFTLAIAVFCCEALATSRSGPAALALFLLGGFLVEYGHVGIALVVAVYGAARAPTYRLLVTWRWLVVLCMAALCVLNGTATALLALPLAYAMRAIPWELPRAKWAFYAFYPLHLAAFVALGAPGL